LEGCEATIHSLLEPVQEALVANGHLPNELAVLTVYLDRLLEEHLSTLEMPVKASRR